MVAWWTFGVLAGGRVGMTVFELGVLGTIWY